MSRAHAGLHVHRWLVKGRVEDNEAYAYGRSCHHNSLRISLTMTNNECSIRQV